MPLPFGDQSCSERFEMDSHPVPGLAFEHAEAVAQILGDGNAGKLVTGSV